ncbi:hypothetical protein CEXT_245761 [Caerostris extrusa]|uniref:Uncharacterized protein n=1 Tax=Caerostris extrusa TaxID=172846 RepID=A0AAV4XHC5_CAEEX|nr:hypothetical protein CEXT_245761 [Caerostris extrusa]
MSCRDKIKMQRQTTRYRIFSSPARTIHKPLSSVTYCAGKQANKSEGGTSRMMTRKLFTLICAAQYSPELRLFGVGGI